MPTSGAAETTTTGVGVVLFAYDGSGLAKHAIEQASGLLGAGRDALVLTVWQTFDIGFLPSAGIAINGADPLGSHGRTGLAHLLVGSVAGAVAEHSRRPVMIVHREPRAGAVIQLLNDGRAENRGR